MIEMVPLAALVGVMFMVVIETFEWATFKFIRKIPKHDALIIVVVTLVTVFTDLAIAVVTGVVISTLSFRLGNGQKTFTPKRKRIKMAPKEYMLHGPLFFGSVSHFKDLFEIDSDPKEVIIDFLHSRSDRSLSNRCDTICDKKVCGK